ncbi:MAG: hypothetical protein AB7O52_11230 [Planctomycetota bacterium]
MTTEVRAATRANDSRRHYTSERRARRHRLIAWLGLLLVMVCGPATGAAQCVPADGSAAGGPGPDVIVGEVYGPVNSYGSANGYYAYSAGTISCNIGTEELNWIAFDERHPVIGQNLYRFRDGRFEQIGQSWLKQGFTALQQDACGCGCISSGTGTRLGIGCSDPYSADLNGAQSPAALSSRLEVTAPHSGTFVYPPALQPPVTDLTGRRLRVHGSDIDPTANVGAQYFLEAQYLTPDDANAGNAYNNTSFRRVSFGANPVTYPMLFAGPTQRQRAAIEAWRELDPAVELVDLFTGELPYPGRLIVGCNVIDEGTGTFRYEYAVYNQNSSRAVASFSIPVAPTALLDGLGFHDVDYHSGDLTSGTDWNQEWSSGVAMWSTETESQNPNANALRWGTTYNFWFRAATSPVTIDATIGYFKNSPFDANQTQTFSIRGPGTVVVPQVHGLLCANSIDGIVIQWSAENLYDQVRLLRDDQPLALLSGQASTYLDSTVTAGLHRYAAIGVIGSSYSSATSCTIQVPQPGVPRFELSAAAVVADYYGPTGLGTFDLPVVVREDDGNAGYPHATSGLSLALANDPTLLNPTALTLGPLLQALNSGSGPAFVMPSLAPGEVSLAMSFSVSPSEFLTATSEVEVVRVRYETLPAHLADPSAGATTVVSFRDEEPGPGSVTNVVLIGLQGTPVTPAVNDAIVSLRPAIGGFRRGDCNGDGHVDIGDPIYLLAALFPAGAPVALLCADACDGNDDELVDIGDPIRLLGSLFGSPAIPLPAPLVVCGLDPGSVLATLDCARYPPCP